MSIISYSNSFSDDLLLCCEEDCGILFAGDQLHDEHYLMDDQCEESIDEMIDNEVHFALGLDYVARFQSGSLDALARHESVLWILKVQRFYNFQPLTAYLAVNYLDRFLYSCPLTKTNGWHLQLLSVACVSLAAKMEEPLVPTLLDLQVGSPEFVFEPKTIQRMELLVLNSLDWRTTEVILCSIQESSIVEYRPSCIAAAALLCAATEIPFTSTVKPELVESWCDGLHKEKTINCYQFMRQVLMVMNNGTRKPPKVIPSLRVTAPATSAVLKSSTSSDSSSLPYKRRKLNHLL